jgi:hypothetical protein
MADKEIPFSLLNVRPMPIEDELEPVADLSDYTTGDEADEPYDYMSEENLELYRYLCQKDD